MIIIMILTISYNRKIFKIAFDQDKKGIIMPINTIFRESRFNPSPVAIWKHDS